MSDFLNKKKYKRIVYSKYSLVFIFILFFFVGSATLNVYDKERLTKEKIDEVKEDLESLKIREVELKEDIQALKSEEGIEREIRETFGFVKEGEKVLVILEEEASEEEAPKERKTLWKAFVDLFR